VTSAAAHKARLIRWAASGAGMPLVYQSRRVRFRFPQTSVLASGGSRRATSSRKAENRPGMAISLPMIAPPLAKLSDLRAFRNPHRAYDANGREIPPIP
jgi:hypothetical protein